MSKRKPSQRKPSNRPTTLGQLRRQVERQPESAKAWLQLGQALFAQQGEPNEAHSAFERVLELEPHNHEALEGLAQLALKQHQPMQALKYLEQAQELAPNSVSGLNHLARTYLELAASAKAVEAAEKAAELAPDNQGVLDTYGSALASAFRFEEAKDVFDRLTRMGPESFVHWNNAGNMRRELGLLDQAYECYRKAAQLAPHNPIAYSNHLTALHYDPNATRDQISEFARSWERRFSPSAPGKRPEPTSRQANKRLRIGMLSDGFRKHPVGRMIVRCLEHLDAAQTEIYAYSSSEVSDQLTQRLKPVTAQWRSIRYLTDDELNRQLREDALDILIDLSGHNAGTRMRVMAMQPAPLLVKWVGGLINTTGVQAIDYLISDRIETPPGEDAYYTEKLIRMPDDYIVFDPPSQLPSVSELPAKRNGYITLACFNNPTKLNGTTVKHWAQLMHQLPNSRLLLKGRPYTSEGFCERLYALMETEGISRERLVIEGPGSNHEMLEAYSRADIALDPWPYSGGLTTCEAFIMGVPVVTLTGPTFAGRHSATHLVNAGMPELVTQTWEEYHERVLELASDLESLATIRQHLREVLLQSPVCDGPRFAKHFTMAMRAIWQRYCDGKPPSALTFDQDGQARFEGEDKPVEVEYAEPLEDGESGFTWQLPSKIITLDNGAKLLTQDGIHNLRRLNAFGIVAFDPASRVTNPNQYQGSEDVQVFPHTALGNGQPGTLYTCLDASLSSTLEPLPTEEQYGPDAEGAKVLAKLPINTISLDSIEGLDSLDWLILDDLNDAMAILEHGEKALKDTLLIQVRIAFQPTHQRQPNLAEVQHWMSRHGFRFYRFNDEQHRSYFPESVDTEQRQATELVGADALFLPSHPRTEQLNSEQCTKLAFLLHTVYRAKDVAYALLMGMNKEKANTYLEAESLLLSPTYAQPPREPDTTSEKSKRKVFVVGFPKSGTSTIHKALTESGYTSAHWKVKEGFVGQLMYQGLKDHDDPWHYLQRYDAITQGDVCLPNQGINFWPNLDFDIIKKIQEKHPDCLFVFNYRAPKKIVSSICRWGDAKQRFTEAEIIGLPSKKGSDEELHNWIVKHTKKVRTHFSGNRNFIEIDIEDNDAPCKLGEKLGTKLSWWGVANENKNWQPDPELPEAPFMSTSERQLFKKQLEKSSNYFEFGSGGSTVWAANMGLRVKGVESDPSWINALKKKIGDRCMIEAVDIGPIKEWGFPASNDSSNKFKNYSQSILSHDNEFDLILIDGRFRVACTLAAIQHIMEKSNNPQKTKIFIHDFWNRQHYHMVLEFLEPLERAETAGVFKVKESCDLERVKKLWHEYATQPA